MTEDQKLVKSVWPEWELTELIGTGSYGDVYRARRISFSGESVAAIKIIRIDSGTEGYGLDERQRGTLLESIARDAVREIKTMEALKGCSNVVGIDDHQVVPGKDGKPWYILLRMQLLTPLFADLETGGIDEAKVRRIGLDLCHALQACEKHRIVHRDIKPENVFVSDDGVYKLGDFGVARQIETVTNRTRTGTRDFMAPEVYNGTQERADFRLAQRADMYSLGMLLYWLANGRRQPFVRRDGPITANELQEAFRRKINGEPLPAPANVSPALGKAILKACAYKPEDRYEDADAFLRALENTTKASGGAVAVGGAPASAGKKKRRRAMIACGLILFLALAATAVVVLTRPAPETSSSSATPRPTHTPGTPADPTPSPTPSSDEHREEELPQYSGAADEADALSDEELRVEAGAEGSAEGAEGYEADGEESTPLVPAGTAEQGTGPAASAERGKETVLFGPLAVGDRIRLGLYEQDNDADNGPEEIVWVVAAVENDRALLLSEYVLDAHRFNEPGLPRSNIFENSEVFDWLNVDFLQTAFTAAEQNLLNSGQTDGCPVFLLPAAFADHLPADVLGGVPTAYAQARGAKLVDDTGLCWWWTSTAEATGEGNGDYVKTVNSRRSVSRIQAGNGNGGIRPAIWLPLN